MISARQIGAQISIARVRVRVWGWGRLGLWLSSGHLLLSGDELGL